MTYQRLFCSLFVIAVFFILLPFVGDTDFWFHLRMGQYMAESHSILSSDAFTYTRFGVPFVDHEWLAQIIFFAVYKLLGFNGVASLVAIIAAITLWVAAGASRRTSWVFLAGIAIAAYCLQGFFVPRPQIFAYLMLAALMLILLRFLEARRWRTLLFLAPIFLFWGNVHASVILGVGVLFMAGGVELLGKFLSRSEAGVKPNVRDAAALFGAAFGGFIFSLINPFGIGIYRYALGAFKYTGAYTTLIETQPFLDVLSRNHMKEALFIHIFVLGFLVWVFRKHRGLLSWHRISLFLLFWAIPFFAVKFLPFSWMVLLPIVFLIIRDLAATPATWLSRCALILAVILVILGVSHSNPFRYAHTEWPEDLASFIIEKKPAGNIYNPYSWGGYLMWMAPELKVSQYGGLDADALYSGLYQDMYSFGNGEMTDELIGKYQFSFALVRPWEQLAYQLSVRRDWALVYWDNFGMIYIRRGTGNDPVIREYEMRIPYMNDTAEAVIRKVGIVGLPALIGEYKEAIRRQPDLRLARFQLGLIEQAAGDCKSAIPLWRELVDLDMALGAAHGRLAQCYAKLGYSELAATEGKLANQYADNQRWWFGRE